MGWCMEVGDPVANSEFGKRRGALQEKLQNEGARFVFCSMGVPVRFEMGHGCSPSAIDWTY